ncbi:MAG TPA: DHH family phosphoesterase [bacterium]|nr:DHH family phosphoesterase [bacterium]
MATLPVREIAATLRTSRSVLIVCHVGPDGDCIGSALALALALDEVRVPCTIGSADGVPLSLRFLPSSTRIVTVPPQEAPDTSIAMECSTPERAGVFAPALMAARTVINLDHHLSNSGYGTIVYWDQRAAAAGEQVHEIIRALGVPMTPEIAECLLAAVVTDTGVFRYPNVTPQVLRRAADLVEAGGSVHRIVEEVYETKTASSLRLLGRALAEMHRSADGRAAWTVVTPKMMADTGAIPEETTGITGALRQILGVRVALMFEQTPEGIRVSIRSRDGARSNVIADAFGGGGHSGAAGFTSPGRLDDVIAATLREVQSELDRPTS